ncbi:MAG: hypothetical protein ACE14L_10505 [Terriglobales bacterium]
MKPRILLVAVLVVSAMVAWAQGATRTEPSTPEERQKALQYTKDLERQPLGPEAERERAWLTKWIIEIPDITVPVCDEVLKPLLVGEVSQYRYSKELVAQALAGSAAYLIQHPPRSSEPDQQDDFGINKAGLESALNAYQSIVRSGAKGGKWAPLEELVKKRNTGELDAYVRQATLKCLTGDTIRSSIRPPTPQTALRACAAHKLVN